MENELPDLDEYCKNIMVTLLLSEKKIRFNKLYYALKDLGLKLSKPTLSDHLKHLTKKKLVTRKVEDVQNVSYKFNDERFRSLKSTVKYQKIIAEILNREKERFNSLSVSRQIGHVWAMLAINEMQVLKLLILTFMDPSKKFERGLQMLYFRNQRWRHYEGWLIQNCKKDNEFGKKAIEIIDKNIEELMSETFENYAEIKEKIPSPF